VALAEATSGRARIGAASTINGSGPPLRHQPPGGLLGGAGRRNYPPFDISATKMITSINARINWTTRQTDQYVSSSSSSSSS